MHEFLSQYKLLSDFPPKLRYHTKAAQYYRERLMAIVEGKDFPDEEPDYDTGREIIESYEKFLGNRGGKNENSKNVLFRKRSHDFTNEGKIDITA